MALTIELIPGETWPDGSAINLPRLRNTAKPSIKIDGLLGTGDIEDGAITEPKLANNAVSTRTIQDGAVTKEKLRYDAHLYQVDQDTAPNVVTVSPPEAQRLTSLVEGIWLTVRVRTGANTGPVVLNYAGTERKMLKANGAELRPGDLRSNMIVELRYNTTMDSGTGAWQVMSGLGSGDVSAVYTFKSDPVDVPAPNSTITFEHGLTNRNPETGDLEPIPPHIIRAVLIRKEGAGAFSHVSGISITEGMEIDCACLWTYHGMGSRDQYHAPAFRLLATPTHILVNLHHLFRDGPLGLAMLWNTTDNANSSQFELGYIGPTSDYQLRLYATAFDQVSLGSEGSEPVEEPPPGLPTITEDLVNVSEAETAAAEFTIEATSATSVQWFRDGIKLDPGGRISISTSVLDMELTSTLIISDLLAAEDDGAVITAIVAGPGGTVDSAEAILTVTTP
jgi:hypothetical protein